MTNNPVIRNIPANPPPSADPPSSGYPPPRGGPPPQPGQEEGAGAPPTPNATRLGRGLAALRIFVGVILLANGLAKVFSFAQVRIGPYAANLIDRDSIKFILDFEVNQNPANGGPGTRVPLLSSLANDVLLPNIGVLGWLIAIFELVVGLMLILGLVSRGAGLLALLHGLGLALLYFSSDRWLFEQPHDYVPAAILALVPSGLVWGLDGRLPFKRARQGRWPF